MAPSFLLRWLCRVYRVLMYAYPPDFRRRYGREMEQVFGDRCRHMRKNEWSGWIAAVRRADRS